MPKQKKLTQDTSYDSVYYRFQTSTLLKTDYSFIASLFSQFKDNIVYTLLKARINSDIQTILRTPKQSSESAKDMGHLEGLDAVLNIIDHMSRYDENIRKDEEKQEETTLDQEVKADSYAPIQDVE